MKTYTESKNETLFNWNKFLNQKEITEKEWSFAKDLSVDWVTCACGNQCDVIPRYGGGGPKDILLYNLGMSFTYAIDTKNIQYAKDTLHKIELRSSELINEINK
tara:strand:- start:1610 stop:1921 length:312 start_codon:yes stop_codon:yes gene_type:complete